MPPESSVTKLMTPPHGTLTPDQNVLNTFWRCRAPSCRSRWRWSRRRLRSLRRQIQQVGVGSLPWPSRPALYNVYTVIATHDRWRIHGAKNPTQVGILKIADIPTNFLRTCECLDNFRMILPNQPIPCDRAPYSNSDMIIVTLIMSTSWR